MVYQFPESVEVLAIKLNASAVALGNASSANATAARRFYDLRSVMAAEQASLGERELSKTKPGSNEAKLGRMMVDAWRAAAVVNRAMVNAIDALAETAGQDMAAQRKTLVDERTAVGDADARIQCLAEAARTEIAMRPDGSA